MKRPALLVPLLALVLLGNAQARELVRERFDGPGRKRGAIEGQGREAGSRGLTRAETEHKVKGAAYDSRDVDFNGVVRGAFSFDLQRLAGADPERQRTVFTLAGDAGQRAPFFVQILWSSPLNPGLPMLLLGGQELWYRGLDLWQPRILLDRPVAEGEWIHVDLTWDDESGRYELFVEGRRQDTGTYYEANGQEARDPRVAIDEESRRFGRPTHFSSGTFGRILALARAVDIGVHTEGNEPDVVYTPLSNATLDNFVIHVDEVPAPGYVPPPSTAPAVASVDNDASRVAGFSGRLVAGDALGVTLTGSPGAAGTFDVVHFPDIGRKLPLDWSGWGVYLEEKVFFEPDEVNLRDVDGYRVYAATVPFDPLAPGFEPAEELQVGEQSCVLENLEIDTPYYVAVLAEMRDGTLRTVLAPVVNQPLAESAPGTYTGTWTVGYQDRYPRAAVVGRLAAIGESTSLVDTAAFVVDPSLTIAVATDPSELKADEKSAAKVTVTLTDANGTPVSGHKVKFLLATTSQYTGVVGGGAFAEQVGGVLQESTWGQTDLFGRLTATYVAGFAAKTAVIVARDMASNSTGAGYVKTYIQGAAELELLPVVEVAAAAGYEITLTSSDEWLTADGKSQARITAEVTHYGQPVEGHKVAFSVPAGSGSVRTVSDTTDRNGKARAVYTAGMKIGIVLVTATDTTVGISGSVPIELRSDAPAKIAISLDPEKLPADGRSVADVKVLVTDYNGNPNDNVEVEYRVAQGGGSVKDEKATTDRGGESATTYVAGRTPGRATLEITVRSTAPTAVELLKARALAIAVTDYQFF